LRKARRFLLRAFAFPGRRFRAAASSGPAPARFRAIGGPWSPACRSPASPRAFPGHRRAPTVLASGGPRRAPRSASGFPAPGDPP